MKIFLLTLLLPFTLNAVCRDCDFPYRQYLGKYRFYYESAALYYSMELIEPDELTTEREHAIFYSGGAFSIQQLIMREEQY